MFEKELSQLIFLLQDTEITQYCLTPWMFWSTKWLLNCNFLSFWSDVSSQWITTKPPGIRKQGSWVFSESTISETYIYNHSKTRKKLSFFSGPAEKFLLVVLVVCLLPCCGSLTAVSIKPESFSRRWWGDGLLYCCIDRL